MRIRKKIRQKLDELRKKWYSNADDIAEFLSGINPYWNKKKWRDMSGYDGKRGRITTEKRVPEGY